MQRELKFNLTMISEHHSFEVYGFVFDPKATYESYGSELKVVLLTSINSKVVGGRLFLNDTSGTHNYSTYLLNL